MNMSNFKINHPFYGFRWHKLGIILRNARLSPRTTAHPISIFQAIVKAVSFAAESKDEPIIFFHLKDKKHTYKMFEYEQISLEIFFFKCDLKYAELWREVLKVYLSDPVSGGNFEISEIGNIEERNFDLAEKDFDLSKTEGETCLEFLAPFPFKTEKDRDRTYISKFSFIQSFEKRFSRLLGKEIVYESRNDNFSIFPYYWNYTEIAHRARSQPGQTQHIKGCVGKFYIKGVFKDFLPFLVMGAELHIGPKISNSQGYYKLLSKDNSAYFQNYFPDKKAILSVMLDVIEKYDEASEALEENEGFSLDKERFAEKLASEIKNGTYLPSPNTAFVIKKKNGNERLIEKLSFKDLIVQQYLAKTISKVFDRIFEESSIGFRKGMSRENAVEIVQNAVFQGCKYVIEADIEDFFSSIDLKVLSKLLDKYIPENDFCLKNLLSKAICNGYALNGELKIRAKGLAQGSPLSPILANLYLDSFDEKIKSLGMKMARYADDFIILVHSKEEAESAFSKVEILLGELSLKIKKEKFSIKHIKEGFWFLGIRFEKSEVKIGLEEYARQFKKPIYITEPYIFLSLSGDAVEIKKRKIIIETIPLRRISEIIIMNKAVFSTALLKKCAASGIPLTITLNSGYYITTVKPDSKKYYDISFEHGRKYLLLSETEIFCIAKEFAIGKLRNYISLFKQRYAKGDRYFIKEIEVAIRDIRQSDSVSQIRGIEGAATKKIYHEINRFIDNDDFYFKKRRTRNPDRINSLLNFGFYLLFSHINATVRAVGLNPYLGFLHSPADNYESLVSDIEELFRARIARFVIRIINLKIITKEDFIETEKGFYLEKDAIQKFISQFEFEMSRKASEKNVLSMKKSIYIQTLIIKKWALEDGSLFFYEWEA